MTLGIFEDFRDRLLMASISRRLRVVKPFSLRRWYSSDLSLKVCWVIASGGRLRIGKAGSRGVRQLCPFSITPYFEA